MQGFEVARNAPLRSSGEGPRGGEPPRPAGWTPGRFAPRARGAAAWMALAALGTALACRPAPPPAPPTPSAAAPARPGAPRLVVLIVADQMRGDFLSRFRPVLSGGLARLLDEGVVFADAHHQHAGTKTAAGHAVLATGRHPSHTGVIGNRWWERASGREVESVDDPEDDISPRRLLGTSLPDWLLEADPASRVLTASGKDRGAVMLGGHRAGAAYWFDEDEGRFVTSTYYRERPPAWVDAFSAAHGPAETLGELWEPLPVADAALAAMQVWPVDRGALDTRFPHAIGELSPALDEAYFDAWEESPAADDALVAFAEAALAGEDLGADERTDYLGLSFSAIDQIGHDFGPNSRETFDAVLRLDRGLSRLLAALDRVVPPAERVIALSADHGVAPLPEVPRASGGRGVRAGREQVRCLQQVHRELQRRHGPGRYFVHAFYLDEATLRAKGLDADAVAAEAAALVAACPGVARVFTRAELAGAEPAGDELAALFRNSFHPERSPDLEIHWQEYFLPDLDGGTTHGSAWSYDTHVPLIVVAPGLQPHVVDQRVHTVDLAPTLARLAGLTPPAGLDGVDRSDLLRRAAPPSPR